MNMTKRTKRPSNHTANFLKESDARVEKKMQESNKRVLSKVGSKKFNW